MKPAPLEAAAIPKLTLAQALRAALSPPAPTPRMPPHHWKVLRAIMACRTPALGGHLYQCSRCAEEHFVPHSCRNRHCPTCQGANGADWMDRQSELLLPIPYFHLVFTLPHDLNPLIAQNPARLYGLLFEAASATLLEFGRNNLKARIGITAVLHTWSQTLLDHYHLHCIVTGGGLRLDGKGWKHTGPRWLFPVRALSKVFRGKFCDGLQQLHAAGKLEFHGRLQPLAHPKAFEALLKKACRQPWIIYAKRPFAGPDAVLAYLSRYTHRVGITNGRLLGLDEQARTVTFDYKDYADGSKHKTMTLSLDEFLRRFRLHILPERFVKIRHYGLLSNRNRHTRIAQARAVLLPLNGTPVPAEKESFSTPGTTAAVGALPVCPRCGQPALVLLKVTHAPKRRVDFCDSS